jgi:hypothetical protein
MVNRLTERREALDQAQVGFYIPRGLMRTGESGAAWRR